MSNFTKDTAFDVNSIEDENIKEQLGRFFDQYNSMVQELGQVLRSLDFGSNFGSSTLSVSFVSGQDVIVAPTGKTAIIVECTEGISEWKLISQNNGLILNITTSSGNAGTAKLLVI